MILQRARISLSYLSYTFTHKPNKVKFDYNEVWIVKFENNFSHKKTWSAGNI